MSGLFETLCQALPLMARFSCGFATVVRLRDLCRKTVDGEGNELNDYPLENQEGFDEAVKCTQPRLIPSKISNIFNLFIPLGDCLLILNNAGHVGLADKLKATFEEAVPFIARVTGGEAVLFDREGIRFFSVEPDGRASTKGLGQFTYLGKRAMELGHPVIGPSLLEDGALAVRIPITDEFGLGFNNVVSVKQKKLLAASIRGDRTRYTFSDIVGKSEAILGCIQQAHQVAGTSSTVLVCGETGTGKELFVQSIHNASQQSRGPFVAVNCGAIPSSLVESQLFGYEAGAFTGAQKQGQQGFFEQASGGTLFLDEISEMGLELQSRLLRVLQERELVRIGGKKIIPLNVRVIASTNVDLWHTVTSGKFRQDLYYRLNVVELWIPPLRERVEDIPLLVRHFIDQFRANFGSFVQDIADDALNCLISYPWPGNVRELRNCLERIMNLTTHEVIQLEDIPVVILKGGSSRAYASARTPAEAMPLEAATANPASRHLPGAAPQERFAANASYAAPPGTFLRGPTQAMERTLILQALEKSAYNRRQTAGMLGISTTTLWRKMKRLRISPGS
jgi:sigma-54 dependent transcriptional regulator, acetoin dehydrogenase operon transcriptional activator AcoR